MLKNKKYISFLCVKHKLNCEKQVIFVMIPNGNAKRAKFKGYEPNSKDKGGIFLQ